MAITWSGSSGYMRVGVDLSWSGTPDSGRVTVTAVYYLESDGYGHNWTSALHRWGEIAGDVPVSFYSPWGGTVRIEAARQRVTLPTAYGAGRTYGFGASLGPIWNGGTPAVVAYITVPARQWETPYAPTNVTATTSDGRTATVSWTQPIDAAHPVGASGVERWESGTTSWVRVGTLQLTAHSWTDTSLKPGRGYWYRVWAWNGRESTRVSTGLVYSAPTAPTAVAAAKTAAGDIRVSWTPSGVYTHEAYEAFDVYDNDALVASAVRASTWTHTAPSTATTHTYTIRARVPSGLISAPSAPSNTVQLLCRPGTPQPTGPAGAQTPGPITLTWLHASLDTTAQTSAQVRYRAADAADWTTATTTVEQSWTTPALAAGVWQWQGRTRGAWQADQEEGWSPWSAQQRLVVADLPVTEIVSPPSAVETSRIKVTWSYFQAQSHRQVAAAVSLAPVTLGVAGDPVESATVTGPAVSWAPSTSLADSTDWLVSVTVVSETGQRSAPATRLLHVAYPPPTVPVVEAVWDETTGAVGVGITNPAPLAPGLRRTNLLTDPRLRDPSAWAAAGASLTAAGADGGLAIVPRASRPAPSSAASVLLALWHASALRPGCSRGRGGRPQGARRRARDVDVRLRRRGALPHRRPPHERGHRCAAARSGPFSGRDPRGHPRRAPPEQTVIVVDASAMIEALVADRVHPALLDALDDDIHAPHLLDLEVLSVLRGLELSRKLPTGLADSALRSYFALSIERHEAGLLANRVWSLRFQLTSYDASYIALAEALRAPLVTCDAKLATRGHLADVRVIARGDR